MSRKKIKPSMFKCLICEDSFSIRQAKPKPLQGIHHKYGLYIVCHKCWAADTDSSILSGVLFWRFVRRSILKGYANIQIKLTPTGRFPSSLRLQNIKP